MSIWRLYWFYRRFALISWLRGRKTVYSVYGRKISINPISTHTIRREILRWIRIWSQKFHSAYAFRWKFGFKILRGRISKIFTPLNQKFNLQSYDMCIAYVMSHMWVIEAFFKKWLIAHYSRMKPKFKNPKPYNVTLIYADFIFEDQNQRQWPSSEKLSPTFFGTSNFETWLSRDPITWHPEVRFLGYKMAHFITLSPQKNFSRTLQILGSIAEPCHWWWSTRSWKVYDPKWKYTTHCALCI